MQEQLEEQEAPRPGELIVETATDDSTVTVSLTGELDIVSSQKLERQLTVALANDTRKVVVDMTGLQFIDSTGLRVLLRATRLANDAGRELVIRNPQAQVHRLLQIAGIIEVFSLERD